MESLQQENEPGNSGDLVVTSQQELIATVQESDQKPEVIKQLDDIADLVKDIERDLTERAESTLVARPNEEQSSDMQKRITELEKELEESRKSVDYWRVQCTEAKSELDQLRLENGELKSTILRLNQEVNEKLNSASDGVVAELEAELHKEQNLRVELEKRFSELSQEVRELRASKQTEVNI